MYSLVSWIRGWLGSDTLTGGAEVVAAAGAVVDERSVLDERTVPPFGEVKADVAAIDVRLNRKDLIILLLCRDPVMFDSS